MHILFHCFEYPPQGFGVGAYIRNMAQGLVATGHCATVVCGRANGLPEVTEEDGVTVYRCYGHNEIRSPEVTKHVLDLARTLKVDWIEGADHMGECASLLSCRHRPPVVIKVHNCNALKVVRESLILFSWQRPLVWAAILRSFRQFLAERRSIRNANILIAPSLRIIEELRLQNMKLPGYVIHIANPIIPETDQLYNIEPEDKNVLFVGRLSIGKGIHILPALMRRLRGSGAILEIAGADSYARGLGSVRRWLEKQLEADIAQVRFLGRVDPDDMAKVFQRARVVIVPSRWDNFPTVILEAMKYARPVVASTHGGMPEMLDDTLCEAHDLQTEAFAVAVKQYFENPEYANACGWSMREKLIKTYTPEKIVERYLKAISNCLKTES